MKTNFILILALFSTLSFAQSFSQLGSQTINDQWELVDSKLTSLLPEIQPVETKQLRKDIGLLKIHLDVFAPCYKAKKKSDQLLTIRDDIDKGYEVIGHYKDIYDTFEQDEVTQELIDERRTPMLSWVDNFLKSSVEREDISYLQNPIQQGIEKRDEADLAKFFWRQLEYRPDCSDSGDNVLRKMVAKLLKVSKKKLKKLLKLEDLLSYKRENKFHDFRKQVRSLLKLFVVYPEIFKNRDINSEQKLLEMIGMFGDLNDQLVALHHASGKKKDKLKKIVKKEWKSIQEWLKVQDIKDTINSLKDSLSN